MSKRTIIPFGPQHPVLPEPIHLDLIVEDEKVVEAVPSIGFIHRGLEKLVDKRDFLDYVFVAERICGICSFTHGMSYCIAVEEVMNLPVPERALALRTFWAEIGRIHSHLLWLGLMADAFGFESLFMHTWRLREKVLDIYEETTGGRVIFNVCKPGGIRRDVTDEKMRDYAKVLNDLEPEIREINNVFMNDKTVHHRMCGVGVLSAADALKLGCVGPVLRATGVAQDMRHLNYAWYSQVNWKPATRTAGDCQARCEVRIDEIYQAIDIVRQIAGKMPAGEIACKVPGTPNGEYFVRTEQPRGEAVYYIKANGARNLVRFRIRTPTFANIPALVKALQGCDLADVPVLALTIDPCISCTER